MPEETYRTSTRVVSEAIQYRRMKKQVKTRQYLQSMLYTFLLLYLCSSHVWRVFLKLALHGFYLSQATTLFSLLVSNTSPHIHSTLYFIFVPCIPIYPGLNSNGDMASMISTVYPLLVQYEVDAYFSAHNHILEVFRLFFIFMLCMITYILYRSIYNMRQRRGVWILSYQVRETILSTKIIQDTF